MIPTIEQSNIINETGNLVTVAKPWSGKTFVLAEKIKRILPELKEFQGIIAISFTNKASIELKERSLINGLERKESFFGTIHKFYISEIVLSFWKQIFWLPVNELEIVDLENSALDEAKKSYLKDLVWNFDYSNPDHISTLEEIFRQGKIYLSLIEKFAIYIFDNSSSCRRYMQLKYKYIIIDEFQDCGSEQYEIFIKLQQLGLYAIAVGDLDQSIYGFAGRSSLYLQQLMNNQDFKTFSLSMNHRCHPSIINYSLKLMSSNASLLPYQDTRVYHRHITGSELSITNWIDKNIDQVKTFFNVDSLSNIAILTRGHRTAKIIDDNLITPHKIVNQSLLESDTNEVSFLFDNILKFTFSSSLTITEIVEKFVSLDTLKLHEQIKIKKDFNYLSDYFTNGNSTFSDIKETFTRIASILMPLKTIDVSLSLLEQVLLKELDIYSSNSENEIQILTIHKSKGLEFDIVFHLDLYEWIFPAKKISNNTQEFLSYDQDLNLHYVGITRAKKACILFTSSKRTNYKNKIIDGNISDFLKLNSLNWLRK